jgi:hypothetical protein
MKKNGLRQTRRAFTKHLFSLHPRILGNSD